MAEKARSWIEELRKWSVTGMVALLIFAGKSTIRDVVREEIGELQRTVRRLEIQVATLEANSGIRERAQERRFNQCEE
jgi:hypothetical protein